MVIDSGCRITSLSIIIDLVFDDESNVVIVIHPTQGLIRCASFRLYVRWITVLGSGRSSGPSDPTSPGIDVPC